MVLLSALIHVIVLVYMATSVSQGRSEPRVLQTYTVALVSPQALGLSTHEQPEVSDQAVRAAVPKKEIPSQKPKATQKEVQPVKVAKAVPKKKKTVKITAKKKTTRKKRAYQKVQVKTAKKPKREVRPEPTPAKKQPSPQKDTQISAQKRDQQIFAALEKVRRQVKGASDQARPAKTDYSKRGASSQGDGRGEGTVRGLQFILYTEQVKRRVKQSWIVAELKTGLRVVVRFGIQADGEVFDVELAQRSGDIVFDESAVRAVRKASPLPPPPVAYRYEFARKKVEVVFGETSRGPIRVQ